MIRKGNFTIDSLPDFTFDGYTEDEEWNGWACPNLTFDQAEKIVEAHLQSSITAGYDISKDAFFFEVSGETEEYEAVIVDGLKLYPIGDSSWIWEEQLSAPSL